MNFPQYRPRRLRQNALLRDMVAETQLCVHDLVMPLFVRPGKGVRREIASMPGNYQLSVDELVREVAELRAAGVRAAILFGIPDSKDAAGTQAYDNGGIVQQAIRAIKKQVPEFIVITDVCLCEYTDHGHCGVLSGERVENDPTLELLAKMALSHANAGADIVAPSDMMDGRVQKIRSVLDAHSFHQVPIMAYSAKYASAFYGPFREAAESAPQFGDRRSYQMDARNGDEALREVRLDIAEGADIVMVKPALAYLDIIRRVRDEFGYPVAAYNVSGEYSMVKAAAARGWLDEQAVALEILTSIKRAGAGIILTYWAKDAAGWL
ncbi:MAG TPA: porphobilinogen synthase [Planctomycetota bacterium]|nr:porphobilinogen synthase [Planctomycetota bacterium]